MKDLHDGIEGYLEYIAGRVMPHEKHPIAKHYHWDMYNLKFSMSDLTDHLTQRGISFEFIDKDLVIGTGDVRVDIWQRTSFIVKGE